MDPDYVLALHLQKQLEVENYSTPPRHSNNKENYNKNKGSNEKNGNLIDPSWELIDPTPNIFSLFVQFDKRFFWNKLNAVIVKWSKRMTTCAGICSYQGRGGACTVSLSEPLLKLRPRKDLIETLLHEMIHAYLFVTHNNRDRDGHGPEFHKHMYRINGEAGTKISVYHDFHDEVRLYKTHWWRCNGPCQKRGPFYGMVKRASNRAPGPNDRWWDQHKYSCNGSFIKIREPDKKSKNSGGLPTKSVPVTDIRKYLDTNNQPQVTSGLNKIHTIGDLMSPVKSSKSTGATSQIQTFKDINKKPNSTQQTPTAQIQTFKDLNNKQKTGGNAVMNKGSGTIVVRGSENDKKKEKDPNPLRINNFKPFSGNGYSLTSTNNETASFSDNDDEVFAEAVKTIDNQVKDQYANVRDFWANKYPGTSTKRHISEPIPSTSTKRHVSDPVEDSPKKIKTADVQVEEINNATKDITHVDIIDLCDDDDDDDSTVCPICSKLFNLTEINEHVNSCLESSFNGDFDDLEDAEMIKSPSTPPKKQINCLVCNKLISESQLNVHLETCITDVFEDEIVETNNPRLETCVTDVMFQDEILIPDSDVIKNDEERIVSCPCCPRLFKESEINAHLDICLALNF